MTRILLGTVVALVAIGPLAAQEGRKLALLVGINEYNNRKLDDLKYAERDVTELAKVLKAAGYDVRLLLGSATGDDEAKRENIQRAIEALLDKVKKKDTLLVAMAGHGVQFRASDVGKEEAYFCPKGAILGRADTLVSLSKLLKDLDERGGRSNLLLVDACRNDPDPNRGRGIDGSRVESLPEGTAVLFSCSKGQRAYESEKAGGGHGVFFHFVLEGLSGKAANDRGEVTWNRLVTYVIEEVDSQFEKLVSSVSVQQRPHEIKNFSQNLVLLDTGRVVARRPTTDEPPVKPKEPVKPKDPEAETYHPTKLGSKWRFKANGGNVVDIVVAGHDRVGDQTYPRLEISANGTLSMVMHIAMTPQGLFKMSLNQQAVQPPHLMLKLPYREGNTWRLQYQIGLVQVAGEARVTEEEVTVAAGTFKALKVAYDFEIQGVATSQSQWFVKGIGLVLEKQISNGMEATMELEKFTPAN